MPVAFLQLERNRQYWLRLPYPATGAQVSFRGSQILFQYFPGEGLQLHPLSTFKKANALHGFCERGEPECDEAALRTILDEMTALAVKRGRRFIAWEYLFYFGGGYPPWMSGMAQATGIQAYARASQLLARALLRGDRQARARRLRDAAAHRRPHDRAGRRRPLPAVLVRAAAVDLQRLPAVADRAPRLREDHGDERAQRLYDEAEPEARKEVPLSDVGDWSRYSYAGNESTAEYHELLREFLQSMCTRRLGAEYCDYARRYRGYQVDPPVLTYRGPAAGTADRPVAISFTVSKLSAVELTVTRPDGRVVFSRLATFRRGGGSFSWTPRGPGFFTVSLGAKELRTGYGKKDRVSAEVEVTN